MMVTAEKELRLLGASHRTAPAEVRESLGRIVSESKARLVSTMPADFELVVLSTCNRTELYTWAAAESEFLDGWLRHIVNRLSSGGVSTNPTLYQLRGESAVRHLFRVACGLDSAVLGDMQILAQIREARMQAMASRTVGSYLDRLCTSAVRAGKRARHETEIGFGAASIGSALVSMLRDRSKSGPSRILLIGAGDAARNIGQHLVKSQLGSVVCINRTLHKAVELASRLGGEARPLSELGCALLDCDLVIAATSASEPVLRKDDLDLLADRRGRNAMLIVDAGLPRNVEAGVRFDVIGIDDIRERQEQVLARRQASAPSVERIVQEAVEEWRCWLASQPMEDLLQELFQELPGYANQTAALLVESGELSSEKAEQILAKSLRKLLYRHAHRLRNLVPTSLPASADAG